MALQTVSPLRYSTYNAFSTGGVGGSAAVMVDAGTRLTTDQMQRLARQFGEPATCFIVAAGETHADVRFFSTMTEYGMCGHGTIALARWLVDEQRISATSHSLTVRTSSGTAVVDVAVSDGAISAMLHLAVAQIDSIDIDRATVAAALGIPEKLIHPSLPLESTRSDFHHLLVPMATLAAQGEIQPDFSALSHLYDTHSVETIATFTTETVTASNTVHTRDFCPAVGTNEAAATGTTNRAIACYLHKHGLVTPTGTDTARVIAEQGHEMDSPSEIVVDLSFTNEELVGVSVGGLATRTASGVVAV